MNEPASPRFDTQLIHAGELEPRVLGAVAMPIFQSAMYEYGGEKSYDALRYIRLNNTPNHVVLHAKLAALERAEAALVTASGMAAISTALLAVLKPGDHLLAQECLYGGTPRPRHAATSRRSASRATSIDRRRAGDVDGEAAPDHARDLRRDDHAIRCCASPTCARSPQFAREQQLVSLIDNTFATPVCFRPATLRLRSVTAQRDEVPERPQ